MDEVILRFPHLGEQIFQELEVGSLLHYKQVSRSWKNFIENEKRLNEFEKRRRAEKKMAAQKLEEK